MKKYFLPLLLTTVLTFSFNTKAQWVQTNGPYGGGFVRAFAFIPNGTGGKNIFIGTTNGVYLSTNNGANWTEMNNGLTNPGIAALVVIGTNIFAGTGDGIFLSTNNGSNWVKVNSGASSVKAFAVSGSNLFAGTFGGEFFVQPTTVQAGVKSITDLQTQKFLILLSQERIFSPGLLVGEFFFPQITAQTGRQ